MGKGIAVEFDKRFTGMKELLKELVCDWGASYPVTLAHKDGDRLIFNLITKEKYWGKPTYDTITECIRQMAETCKVNEIKHLAMPIIGCGLDRLEWYNVKNIIKDEFNGIDIEILIMRL